MYPDDPKVAVRRALQGTAAVPLAVGGDGPRRLADPLRNEELLPDGLFGDIPIVTVLGLCDEVMLTAGSSHLCHVNQDRLGLINSEGMRRRKDED